MCLKPFTLHWRLKVTMWKVAREEVKRKKKYFVGLLPTSSSFLQNDLPCFSVFLFIFSNTLLLTSIDSNVHPQWQVTNRSAGRDVHPTFVFLQFSPLFLYLLGNASSPTVLTEGCIDTFAGGRERKPMTLSWSYPFPVDLTFLKYIFPLY